MNTVVTDGFKRVVVMNLTRGECVLEEITKEMERIGLKNGVVLSCIGTFESATLHRVITLEDKPTEEFITIKAPCELSATQGIIADGTPHLHMVFSDLENTYSGHLEDNCSVLYLAEIVIAEIDGEFERVRDGYLKLLREKL